MYESLSLSFSLSVCLSLSLSLSILLFFLLLLLFLRFFLLSLCPTSILSDMVQLPRQLRKPLQIRRWVRQCISGDSKEARQLPELDLTPITPKVNTILYKTVMIPHYNFERVASFF